MTSAPKNTKVPRIVDLVLECRQTRDGLWLIGPTADQGRTARNQADDATPPDTFKLPAEWLSNLKVESFLIRVGVIVQRDQIPCFIELDQHAAAHNRTLSVRGAILPAVSLVLIPAKGP